MREVFSHLSLMEVVFLGAVRYVEQKYKSAETAGMCSVTHTV